MRQMVAAVPRVKLQRFGEGDVALVFGVVVVARPIVGTQTQPKLVPPVVKTVKDVQRCPHVEVGGIRCSGPSTLIVGLDDGILFGQSQFAAHKAVHVAVREVVDDLRSGPTVRAVGRLQVLIGHGIYGVLELLRQVGQCGHPFVQIGFRIRGLQLERADRIFECFEIHSKGLWLKDRREFVPFLREALPNFPPFHRLFFVGSVPNAPLRIRPLRGPTSTY